MTQSSVFENPAVAGRVAQLRDYLTPHASVIFYCCMSGVGPEGSNFLKALSTSWPGRTVVGFVTSGYVDPQYFTAGDVFDVGAAIIGAVPQGMIRRDARGRITLPRMDPRGATAKEARDGVSRECPRAKRCWEVLRRAVQCGSDRAAAVPRECCRPFSVLNDMVTPLVTPRITALRDDRSRHAAAHAARSASGLTTDL